MTNPLHQIRHGQALWQIPETPHPVFTTHANLMRHYTGGEKETFNTHLALATGLAYWQTNWILLALISILAFGEVFFHLHRKPYHPYVLAKLNLWRNWIYSGLVGVIFLSYCFKTLL
jgi:hypothetical protein